MQLKPVQSTQAQQQFSLSNQRRKLGDHSAFVQAGNHWLSSALLGLALMMSGASMAQDNDPLSQYADDAATTSKVKSALLGDQMLSALDIKVQSDDLGAVHLSGTASSPAEVSHATTVARSVSGVVAVQNDIVVASKTNASERKSGSNKPE